MSGSFDNIDELVGSGGDRRAGPVLISWIWRTKHLGTLSELLQACGYSWVGHSAFNELVRFYRDGPAELGVDDNEWINALRFSAGIAIGRIANQNDVDQLIEILASPIDKSSEWNLIGTVKGLGRMRDSRERVIPVLIDLLDAHSLEVPAINSLGKLRAIEATSRLRKLSTDPDIHLRQSARQALRKLDNA